MNGHGGVVQLYASEDWDPLWHSLLYDPSDPRSLCRFAPQRRRVDDAVA